jgi:hypothetical protein
VKILAEDYRIAKKKQLAQTCNGQVHAALLSFENHVGTLKTATR